MAWPRSKKPRSSALPERERSGVHVAAAFDAEPARTAAHNTGVSGTRHTVVEPGPGTGGEPAYTGGNHGYEDEYDEPAAGIEDLMGGEPDDEAPDPDAPGQDAPGQPVPPAQDDTPQAVTQPPVVAQPVIARPMVAPQDVPAQDVPAAQVFPAADPRTRPLPALPEHPDAAPGGAAAAGWGDGAPSGHPDATAAAARSAPGPVWNQTTVPPPQPVYGERESNGGPFRGWLRGDGDAAAGDGGQPRRARVRDLPLDARLRIWRLRALIVVLVGVVFSIVVDWELGITLAILAGIIDTAYRSRTVEQAVPKPGIVDRAQWRAQRRTQRQLARMRRGGYVALHRRPIPDSIEVIDHLVVGPTGVYAIDSEKWDKELPIRFYRGNQLWLGPESKKERLQHAHWEAGQAGERLSAKLGMEVTVQPALAIYGPKIPWDVAHIRGVDVFSGNRLKTYLRRHARKKGRPRLTDEQIRRIYAAAGEVLPVAWQRAKTPVG